MVKRIICTGVVVVCAIVSLFIPHPASARAGSSAGGFRAGVQPAFRAARPMIRAARISHFRTPFVRGRHARNVLVWPGYGAFDPYYYPSDELTPDYGTTGSVSAAPPRPIAVYTPGCRTQTQVVPSERGGPHTVHVTRCY